MLKIAYVGGLGMMSGPAATHLTPAEVVQVVRIHDRGHTGETRDQFRQAWKNHGAESVSDLERLVGAGDLDGVVVCAGKNGDDLKLIAELAKRLSAFKDKAPFILHLSTVSPRFAETAASFCTQLRVNYANYPLTGGPKGAALGGADPKGMLILASGDPALYERLLPMLERLGHPRYFGVSPSAGAVTKLIGHHLVFNGLTGISAGVILHAEAFNEGEIGGKDQHNYLAFLNGGAGGTRQWDLAMSHGVGEAVWDAGFYIRHAVVDAIYAAQLAIDLCLPRMLVQPMINTALAFSYAQMRHPDEDLATHAMVREMLAVEAKELDLFMAGFGAFSAQPQEQIFNTIASLPDQVRDSVLIDPMLEQFETA